MKNNILNQKLHRKGKQWFTVSATALALLGAGSLANKSANADSFNDYNGAHVSIHGADNSSFAKMINGRTVDDIQKDSQIVGSKLLKSKFNNLDYTLDHANINNGKFDIYVNKVKDYNLNKDANLNIITSNGSKVNTNKVRLDPNNISDTINNIKNVQTSDNIQGISLTSDNNNYSYTAHVTVSTPVSPVAPSGGSSSNNISNNKNNQSNNQNHNQNNNQNNNNSNMLPSNDNSYKNDHKNNSNNSQSKDKNANNVNKAQKSVTKAKAAVKQAHSKKAKAKAQTQLKSAQKQVKQEVKINKASNNVQKAKVALKNAHGKKAKAKAQKQLKKVQKALYKASGAKKYNKIANKVKKQLKKAHSKKAIAKAKKQLKQANAQLKQINKMF